MEGGWREGGERVEGGWREGGGRVEGGWRRSECDRGRAHAHDVPHNICMTSVKACFGKFGFLQPHKSYRCEYDLCQVNFFGDRWRWRICIPNRDIIINGCRRDLNMF